jgi:hypothetical protein
MGTDEGSTDPPAGTYTYTQGVDGPAILTATASPGWEFAYWEYMGYSPGHPSTGTGVNPVGFDLINRVTDNPFDVTHDYNTGGYTYQYQAVFIPSSAATNTSSNVPILYVVGIAGALVAAIAVVGVASYAAGKRKLK